MTQPLLRPPARLRAAGRRLWDAMVLAYDPDPHELVLLEQACRTVDDLQRLERELSAATLTVAGASGQPRPNPLIAQVRQHRDLLARQLRQLAPDPAEARRRHLAMGVVDDTPVKHRRRGQRLGVLR